MGDMNEEMFEPDELEKEEEDVEGLHPHTLRQHNPKLITNFVITGFSHLAAYGWYILGILLLGYIVWVRLEPKIKRRRENRKDEQEIFMYSKNPDLLLEKHKAMDEARQRMQEQYNVAATKEKIREGKVNALRRLEVGLGPEEKPEGKSSASVSTRRNISATAKPTNKPRLRPEYNPLTGDTDASSSCRWRPSSRGASGGG